MKQIQESQQTQNKQFSNFLAFNLEDDIGMFNYFSNEQEINFDDFLSINDREQIPCMNNLNLNILQENFPITRKLLAQKENSLSNQPFQSEYYKCQDFTADECSSIIIEDLLARELTYENKNSELETKSKMIQCVIQSPIRNQLIDTTQIDKSSANTNLQISDCQIKQSIKIQKVCQRNFSKTNSTMKQKRQQKRQLQQKILEQQFQLNNNWSKALMKEIGKEVGLTLKQTYKWLWDRKLKEENQFIRSLKTSKNYYGKMFDIIKPQEQIFGTSSATQIFKITKSRK
eukprot:403351051